MARGEKPKAGGGAKRPRKAKGDAAATPPEAPSAPEPARAATAGPSRRAAPAPEAPAQRVLAARAPQVAEPARGTLRDRLRTASVTGAAALALGARPTPARPAPDRPAAPTPTLNPTRPKGVLTVARPDRPPIVAPGAARDRGEADDSFAEALRSRKVEAIEAETLRRLEASRQRLIADDARAAEAELKILQAEQARLVEKGDARRGRLIADYAALVSTGIDAARRSLRDVARVKQAGRGAATLAGRVLDAAGKPVAGADVVFLDPQGEPLSFLPAARTDGDGAVWVTLNDDQLALLSQRGGRISAQARVDGRVVATDAFAAPLAARGAYVFDLRAGADRPAGGGGTVTPGRGGGTVVTDVTRPNRGGTSRPTRGGGG
jgi:hypothetical protein